MLNVGKKIVTTSPNLDSLIVKMEKDGKTGLINQGLLATDSWVEKQDSTGNTTEIRRSGRKVVFYL